MKQLNHENVVKLYNDFEDHHDLYLVMEYMDGGDLYTFISAHMNLNLRIDEEKLWNIYEQCLRGLVYLHKKGLLHRDIKPANLLLNSQGDVKYSDFNVSAIINPDKARDFTKDKKGEESLLNKMTQVGSGKFAAPEINDESAIYVEYDLKIDVYSLGITFCSLAFFEMKIPDDEQKLKEYSPELIQVIEPMINPSPSRRLSALQAYNNFIKYYVEKYVYLSGLTSCIYSLFSSPSIYDFICKNSPNEQQLGQMPIYAKLREIFMEMFYPQQNMNYNMSNNLNINSIMANQEKKTLNHLIFELRNLLLKNGMNLKEGGNKGNNEIDPINIITFLLKKLHDVLNIYRGRTGNLNVI